MEESENALPLDDSFWEHIEHIDFAIAIPVSDTRMLDIISMPEGEDVNSMMIKQGSEWLDERIRQCVTSG